MKVISYNVNGLRAALKKEFIDWLGASKPDVLCLQETKLQEEQFEAQPFIDLGYKPYLFSAKKKGYSGVAILSLHEPDHIEYGMGIDEYDNEGRMIRADFGDLSIASIYHPSGSSGDERQAFKMIWLDRFADYVQSLRQNRSKLLLCGDYNICHEAIDIHDPIGNAKSSGFLPEERAWMSQFLELGYLDSWRMLNPSEQKYTWWSYRTFARSRNKGWRIDYCMATENLRSQIADAFIDNDAVHSDHCPTGVLLNDY